MPSPSRQRSSPSKAPAERRARPDVAPAAWDIVQWTAALNRGREWFYSLPDEARPASITINGRRLVVESPQDYVARIAAQQRAA